MLDNVQSIEQKRYSTTWNQCSVFKLQPSQVN